MNTEKRQRIYKTIMLIVIVAVITFLITSIYMYKSFESNGKYIYITSKDDSISTTLAHFRKLIDKKFLGDIDEEKLLEGAIKGYISGLDDPYTEYISKTEMQEYSADILGNFYGVGVYMSNDVTTNTIVIISAIKGSPAEKAGLKTGDIITKVNGVEYKGEELSEASSKIKGEEGSKVKLEIIRQDETFEVELTRENIKVNHVDGEVLENNIAYIKFNTFDEGCSEEFKSKYEELSRTNLKGLVIDIRNNGGGLVDEAIEILELICNKDSTLLITTDKNQKEEITKSESDPIINLPIILLTNEGTASASEILAGALKDNGKAKIVGTKTYGKGVIQELLTLQDGSGLKITTNEYYTPSRNKINKIGIQPDEMVELPRELQGYGTIEKSEDTQLQKAIEMLK